MTGFAPLLAAMALAQEPAKTPSAGEQSGAGETRAGPPAATATPAASAVPPQASSTTTARPPARAAAPGKRPPATGTPTAPAASTSDRAEAERVASAFVAALARGDADGLVRLCAERFSFDGDPQAGREAVLRTWHTLLAGRAGPSPAIGRIEVVPLADAVARHGRPPARLEPVARPGSLVAIADVGGRTVVLFLARDGTRLAVTGMHD